ncbi:uncharacterized protein LOC108674249 [Hyalella azteca]|uniref:Uncharacterized protein LOC108674249 n=1 Tax=Hyalella azteca TaxID=294128 RepID=A0A979FMC3_HYAAZ|nr:uncharacterized protein LOC108674249 [Hyalella azteca]
MVRARGGAAGWCLRLFAIVFAAGACRPSLAQQGWSRWSDWTPCSRTCDGGVAMQTRRCLDLSCHGDSVRYELCNLTPCPDDEPDFRAVQCAEYNSIPVDGHLRSWVPVAVTPDLDELDNADDLPAQPSASKRHRLQDGDSEEAVLGLQKASTDDPCALVCKDQDDVDVQRAVVLSPRVHDGTRCSHGKRDMCINGVCQRVGCDLKLGSSLELDECGVCGGNGSTCATQAPRSNKPWASLLVIPPSSLTNTSPLSTSQDATSDGDYDTSEEVLKTDVLAAHRPAQNQNRQTGVENTNSNDKNVQTSYVELEDEFLRREEEEAAKLVHFHWELRPTGSCSTSCGGGYQMVTGVCVSSTGRHVLDEHCDVATRPVPNIETCAAVRCPTRWQTGEWGACSLDCGKGYQLREVFCVEPGIFDTKVPDHYCDDAIRPDHRLACNTHDCPRWYEGLWSQCSVSCGSGLQTRVVHCRDWRGRSSSLCQDSKKPDVTRPCRTGVPCQHDLFTTTTPSALQLDFGHRPQRRGSWASQGADATQGEDDSKGASLLPVPAALTHDQPVPAEPTYIYEAWGPCSVTCGSGVAVRSVDCKIFLEISRMVAVLPDDQCPGAPPKRSQPCHMAPCEVTPARVTTDDTKKPSPLTKSGDKEGRHLPPGELRQPFFPSQHLDLHEHRYRDGEDVYEGQLSENSRRRKLKQELPGSFAPFTQSYNKSFMMKASPWHRNLDIYDVPLTDESGGAKDDLDSYEVVFGGHDAGFRAESAYSIGGYQPTTPRSSGYEWRSAGFSVCSATCLGGVQELLVECVSREDHRVVSPALCPLASRPEVITQTCNDQPCPPRWRLAPYSNCTKVCGGGVRTRKVECIHEMTRGGANTMVVSAHLCPQPQPSQQEACGGAPCDAEWIPQPWSKCSASCGGGVKTRTLMCRQVVAVGRVLDQPPYVCPRRRPPTRRRCNKRKCPLQELSFWSNNDINRRVGIKRRRPAIRSQPNQKYLQKKYMKKVKLKVGGEATVFRGVMVKVKCPVRHFDRSRITWWKDGHRLGLRPETRDEVSNEHHVLVTKKGAIKINKINYTDSGVYICRAGTSEANLTIHVKPLPASFATPSEPAPRPDGATRVSEMQQNLRGSGADAHNNFPLEEDDVYGSDPRSFNEVDAGLSYPPHQPQESPKYRVWGRKAPSNPTTPAFSSMATSRRSRNKFLSLLDPIRPIRPFPTSAPEATATITDATSSFPEPSASATLDLHAVQATAPAPSAALMGKTSSRNIHTVEETSSEVSPEHSKQTLLSLEHLTNTKNDQFVGPPRQQVSHNPFQLLRNERVREEPKHRERNGFSVNRNFSHRENIISSSLNSSSDGNSSEANSSSVLANSGRSRQYTYATMTRTHATPGGRRGNSGMSLLTEKIVQSRLNSKKAVEDTLAEGSLLITQKPADADRPSNRDEDDASHRPGNVTMTPLEHVYGRVNNRSEYGRSVSTNDDHVYGSFSHHPSLPVSGEESHPDNGTRDATRRTSTLNNIAKQIDSPWDTLNGEKELVYDSVDAFGKPSAPHKQRKISFAETLNSAIDASEYDGDSTVDEVAQPSEGVDVYDQDIITGHISEPNMKYASSHTAGSRSDGEFAENYNAGPTRNEDSTEGHNSGFGSSEDFVLSPNFGSTSSAGFSVSPNTDSKSNTKISQEVENVLTTPAIQPWFGAAPWGYSDSWGSFTPSLQHSFSSPHTVHPLSPNLEFSEPHTLHAPWPAEPPNSITSGGSRSLPYLQRLLSRSRDEGPSRGGRHAEHSPAAPVFSSHPEADGLFGKPEFLGKATSRDSLAFEWQITNWSECSQTCGYSGSPGGFQVRSTQCLVRVGNVTKPADAQLCEDAGLTPPPTIQDCGLQECPQWAVGPWSTCRTSRCFTLHYAHQRRKVTCETHSGTATSPSQCDKVTKPRHRRECYNVDCVGVWRTGDWSQCMAPCGGQGYRTRLLQCVWNGTRSAAGNACRDQKRPEVVRWCDAPPCAASPSAVPNGDGPGSSKDRENCTDRSRYCNIVRRMNMCRVQHYRELCCNSCP